MKRWLSLLLVGWLLVSSPAWTQTTRIYPPSTRLPELTLDGTLYLPSGHVTDWNTADVTLTHSANTLTLAGGVIDFPAGTAAAPSVGLRAEATGIFSSSAGNVDVTASGTNSWRFAANELFGLRDDASIQFGVGSDMRLVREGAAILQLGSDSSGPITQTAKAPDARAGTDTDTVGGRMNWRTGLSTGNADPAIQFMQGGAATVTSGTGAQTVVDRFTPNAFVVLTDGSATAVVNATIANGTSVGGFIIYTIEVWNGTDNQVETGTVVYSSKNKAGVVTGTITEVSSQQDLDSGTLATTWAISAANPAVISINANSSLTPSTGYPRITFALFNFGQQAVAIQ